MKITTYKGIAIIGQELTEYGEDVWEVRLSTMPRGTITMSMEWSEVVHRMMRYIDTIR